MCKYKAFCGKPDVKMYELLCKSIDQCMVVCVLMYNFFLNVSEKSKKEKENKYNLGELFLNKIHKINYLCD